MLNFKFLNSFRRVSTQRYIPEVDGLRFLAIMPVLIMHFRTVFFRYNPNYSLAETSSLYQKLDSILVTGDVGVLVFFVISGFILSLPFAKTYQNANGTINFKGYFIRRLTRIEPPYIIVLFILFVAHIFIKTADVVILKSSFLASLFYSHNLVFGSWSIINPVAWSLEIEIQFYILVPLVTYLFKIKNPILRHLVIIGSIFLFPVISWFHHFNHLSLLSYTQYFLTGFLVADVYNTYKNLAIKSIWLDSIGFISIILIFVLQYYKIRFFLPFVLFALFISALYGNRIKHVFANQLFSTIGGMCYTTYLIHLPVLAFLVLGLGGFSIGLGFWMDFISYMLVIVLLTTVICAFAFLIIEKPFMNKYWPQLLVTSINKRIKKYV